MGLFKILVIMNLLIGDKVNAKIKFIIKNIINIDENIAKNFFINL